ncbi:MAG: putative MFS family arabinose efflux permease [Alteromonadaceae bacterium]|jgi:predicted MFS family arabinose efflux permease
MWSTLVNLPKTTKQYLLITGNYWAFTLTDGALRMLVVLYFHQLGYSPIAIAMLFLFYEVFGVVTNLIGGWLGARIGLNKTMHIGLLLQIFALLMLTVPESYLTVIWVMAAQAVSGIAKDLNKMSAKSCIKFLVPQQQSSTLFKWVALLTGSKNTLKGVGFFLGALLLTTLGFNAAIWLMISVLVVVILFSYALLKEEIGKASYKAKFSQLLSHDPSLNYLAASRMCLFAARDVWFVVALPVYFAEQLEWQSESIGAFMALWIIVYGIVQAFSPNIVGYSRGQIPNGRMLSLWAVALVFVILPIIYSLNSNGDPQLTLVIGLAVFGVVFAVNSSLHSFVIIAMARVDGVSMDVGFYYMANAFGRLLGTVLSGWIFQQYNIQACLAFSAVLALLSGAFINKVKI